MAKEIKVGDRIKFHSVTRHSDRAVTRKVVGIDVYGRVLVRFEGWDRFIVHRHEIKEHIPSTGEK